MTIMNSLHNIYYRKLVNFGNGKGNGDTPPGLHSPRPSPSAQKFFPPKNAISNFFAVRYIIDLIELRRDWDGLQKS